MKIINGKKFYAKDIRNAKKLPHCDGFDSYDGSNYQWYTLYWDRKSNLVILMANNSGSCWGDYNDYYYDSPAAFAAKWKSWEKIFDGDEDDSEEDEEIIGAFADEVAKGTEA